MENKKVFMWSKKFAEALNAIVEKSLKGWLRKIVIRQEVWI